MRVDTRKPVTLEEFKKLLGKQLQGFSDAKIEKIYKQSQERHVKEAEAKKALEVKPEKKS